MIVLKGDIAPPWPALSNHLYRRISSSFRASSALPKQPTIPNARLPPFHPPQWSCCKSGFKAIPIGISRLAVPPNLLSVVTVSTYRKEVDLSLRSTQRITTFLRSLRA